MYKFGRVEFGGMHLINVLIDMYRDVFEMVKEEAFDEQKTAIKCTPDSHKLIFKNQQEHQ